MKKSGPSTAKISACAGVAAGLGLLALAADVSAQEVRVVTFGAGGLAGAYYDAVSAICDEINTGHGPAIRCSPDPTPGSLYNIFGLSRGDLDFALVQSDAQRAAWEGMGAFERAGAQKGIRSVLALYPEPLTLMVRKDAGIRTPIDLLGKRVDRGPATSGRRATFDRLTEALEIRDGDFRELTEHSTPVALASLCNGTLDAALLVIGHPASSIANTLKTCEVTIAPMRGPALDAFLGDNPDYAADVIPAAAYPEAGLADVPTFSVMATVMTRADLEPEIVEIFTAAMTEGRETLRAAAPVIGDLEPEKIREAGMTAPRHPGAEAAFEGR